MSLSGVAEVRVDLDRVEALGARLVELPLEAVRQPRYVCASAVGWISIDRL